MDARKIFEERLLYALAQSATAGLPPRWSARGLRPSKPNLRPAARIVARVAELPTRREMENELGDLAKETKKNRDGRPGEEELWRSLAREIEALRERTEAGAADVGSLALWTDWPPWNGLQSPLEDLRELLHGASSFQIGEDDPLLDRIARVLLRELARSWVTAAKEEERADRWARRKGGAAP